MQCNVIMLMSRMRGQPVSLYMNRKLERQHTMAPLAALMGPFASCLYEMYDKWCDITCEQVDRTMHEAISHWWSGALPICTKISVENFRQMVLVFFWAPKTGTGLSCTIYKIPVKFSLSLDMKPGSSDPIKWYRKPWSFRKNGKSIIPRKVLPFFRKISTSMNSSI